VGSAVKVLVTTNTFTAKVKVLVIHYSNSLQCTSCQKWVHKKCSGIKGSMSKLAKSFICSGCLNPVTSAGRTSVDNGASAKIG